MKAPWALAVVLLLAAVVAVLALLGGGEDGTGSGSDSLAKPAAAGAGSGEVPGDPAVDPRRDRAPPAGGASRLAAATNRLSVEVSVTDGAGAPLADARATLVQASSSSAASGRPATVAASSDGRLALAGARAWDDLWIVAAPGHAPALLARPRGGEVVVLAPESALDVEVVRADDGTPIQGVSVARRFPKRPELEAAVERVLPSPSTGPDGLATISGLRVGRTPAALSITEPGGAGVLVLDAAVRVGAAGLRVELSQQPTVLTLRILDAEGGPVAGRPVEVRYWGVTFEARTSDSGEVPFGVGRADVPGDEEGVPGITVDLGDGRFWRASAPARVEDGAPVYFVHHVELLGRVDADADAWEIASAVMDDALETESEENYARTAFRAQPWPWDQLPWTALSDDGSFALSSGWQGPQTCLLLRHAATGILAVSQRASPGTEHELASPGLCRVALRRADGADARGWTLQLVPARPDGRAISYQFRPGATLGLEELGDAFDVPRGRYVATLARGGATLELGLLDASGESAELQLTIPGKLTLTGTLRGLLSGERASVPLLFHDEAGRELARTVSDTKGEFSVELLASHPVQVEARWPDWVKWGVYDADVFRWRGWTAPGEEHVEALRDEAWLVIREDETSPLTGRFPVAVEPYSADGDRSGAALEAKTFAPGEEWRLLLPPGDFLVTQSVGPLGDGELCFSQRVTLTAGGTEEVLVEGSQQTLLDLVVRGPFELSGELDLDVRDDTDYAPVSETLIFHGRRGEQTNGYLVDPGDYTVTLKGRLLPRIEGSEPMDVDWTGTATCALGERTTLVVELTP